MTVISGSVVDIHVHFSELLTRSHDLLLYSIAWRLYEKRFFPKFIE